MQNNQEKYPAPALAKGLQVIKVLQLHDAMILEELAAITAIPKASLLRMLDTLLMLKFIERDVTTRKYRTIVRLIADNDNNRDREQLIHHALVELSAATGLTTEWYIPNLEGAVIVDRVEPADRAVKVVAKIGFIRQITGEFEAVARLTVANRDNFKPKFNNYWLYTAGEKEPLMAQQFTQLLATASRQGYCIDCEYNNNGIRRMAGVVKARDGKLCGIITLAESFTPDAERCRQARLKKLQFICRNLEVALTKLGG
jgi:DNA-binding IclR family transcriptional regulator